MTFQNNLKEIDKLQQKIEVFGKLNKDVLQKINNKFRLDWNYYSNKMEGNTLTVEETKSVMVGNIDVHNKPVKDVFEMQGHDEVVQTILKLGKGELNISESRIRDVHKAIMHEDTPSKKEKIGKWKEEINHIINYRDEKFYFTEPSNVPVEMHELINWVNNEKDKIKAFKRDSLHPVELALEFHLRYLTIHPFYDGNGRTGRIFTNIILISYGYPPVYITDDNKKMYYRILADVQAYGADKFLLFNIMAEYLIRSLNIVLDAIEGRNIDESDDLDKKLRLLEIDLEKIKEEVKISYSINVFFENFEGWIQKLIIQSIPLIQKFNKFFTETHHKISFQHPSIFTSIGNENVSEILKKLTSTAIKFKDQIGELDQELIIHTSYISFKKGGLKSFNIYASIKITFYEAKYEIWANNFNDENGNINQLIYERLYHQPLNDKEINNLALLFANSIYKNIDHQTKFLKLR